MGVDFGKGRELSLLYWAKNRIIKLFSVKSFALWTLRHSSFYIYLALSEIIHSSDSSVHLFFLIYFFFILGSLHLQFQILLWAEVQNIAY